VIIKCGVSVLGEFHGRQGTVCQDNNSIYVEDGIAIAAVADGLSSSCHSDEASKEASLFAVNYCKERITKNSSEKDILTIIKESFEKAQCHIERKACELTYELDECDTTLCLAVFFNGDLYYGQAGDSGIFAFREDGFFDRVTEIVIDEDGYVDPLCRSDKWVIEKYSHKVRSILLVTDGVWKMLAPPLLKDQQYPLDHEMLNYYLNNKNLEKINQEQLDEWLKRDIVDISPSHVNHDDKTMVILIDTAIVVVEQDREYYEWPGVDKWNELLKSHEETLYPYRSKIDEAIKLNNGVFEQKTVKNIIKKCKVSKLLNKFK